MRTTDPKREDTRPRARSLVLLIAVCLHTLPAANPAKTDIQSEKTVSATVIGRDTNCYVYRMDGPTTKKAVYWGKPRLYVRLEPCTGLPHLQVSVYGCPSEGHKVNWEFQNTVMRNDLRARGRRVPPDWEWQGDLETLDIDATHKTFYIEVSQRLKPIVTPGDHVDLERRLRDAGFIEESNSVKEQGDAIADLWAASPPNATVPSNASLFQDKLVPQSEYKLAVILYDSVKVPKDRLLPMTNRLGFERTIDVIPDKQRGLQFTDDPRAGHYVIAFWPPTASSNDSMIAETIGSNATTNLSGLRRDDPSRKLLSQMREQDGVVLEPGAAGSLADASFEANPAAAALGAGGDMYWKMMERRAEEERRIQEKLERTERELGMLLSSGVDGVSLAVARAERRINSEEGSSGDIDDGVYNDGDSGDGGGVRRKAMTLYEKSRYVTQPSDLEYKVFFIDVTDDIKEQWGVTRDPQLGTERTRVLNQSCGSGDGQSADLGELQCGVLQWITRVQFNKMDRDKNGYVSIAEYDLEYPAFLQPTPDRRLGFKDDWTFTRAAENGTDNGIAKTSFDEAFEPKDILLASIKDPLKRTFWSPCGIRKIGTPVSPDGVADPSLKGTPGTWLNVTSFTLRQDRRYEYTIKGFNDTDNRIYLVNLIARNIKTGEEVAYKVHAVQREVTVYSPPPIGGNEIGLVVGISVLSGTVAVIVIVAFAINSSKKMRPRLRVRAAK